MLIVWIELIKIECFASAFANGAISDFAAPANFVQQIRNFTG